MDCSTCRSLFSESFDARLSGDRRQGFIIHVQACKPCESEYALYRRVFSAVRGLPDEAAPPFRAPAEVPGAHSAAHAFGRPRFARVAAAILILIGLAGTHVLVFQWSRDHATLEAHSKSAETRFPPPVDVGTVPVLASISPLPPALRDHVDATDLFIQTAARLPDDPSSLDLAQADWASSDLARRTTELKTQALSADVPPEHRAIISQYLEDVEKDFIPNMRSRLDNQGDQPVTVVRAVREAAVRNRIMRNHDLDKMKIIVASLPRGTSFSRNQNAYVSTLRPDGQLFLESKQARLRGDMPRAITGFQRFDTDFQSSPLRPAAQILQFDTLAAAGRLSDAVVYLGQTSCRCQGGIMMEPYRNMANLLQVTSVRIEMKGFDLRHPETFDVDGFDQVSEPQMFGNHQIIFFAPEAQKGLGFDRPASRPAKQPR